MFHLRSFYFSLFICVLNLHASVDLSVQITNVTDCTLWGNNTLLSVGLFNKGESGAEEVRYSVYLSTDKQWSSAMPGILLTSDKLASMNANLSHHSQVTVQLPQTIIQGELNYLHLVIDPLNTIAENNEENNSASKMIRIEYSRDKVPTALESFAILRQDILAPEEDIPAESKTWRPDSASWWLDDTRNALAIRRSAELSVYLGNPYVTLCDEILQGSIILMGTQLKKGDDIDVLSIIPYERPDLIKLQDGLDIFMMNISSAVPDGRDMDFSSMTEEQFDKVIQGINFFGASYEDDLKNSKLTQRDVLKAFHKEYLKHRRESSEAVVSYSSARYNSELLARQGWEFQKELTRIQKEVSMYESNLIQERAIAFFAALDSHWQQFLVDFLLPGISYTATIAERTQIQRSYHASENRLKEFSETLKD